MTGWLTPDTPPLDKTFVRRLFIPAQNDWLALVDGALNELTKRSNWQEYGDMSIDDTIAAFDVMYQRYIENDNEPPDWEAPGDLDGLPAQPWYEALEDWIIAGFLAYTFTPLAAITYQATVPKLRVAFRTGDIGALFRVLINGIEVWTGDSYAPIIDILSADIDASAYETPYTVRIEHNGVGGGGGTRAKLEYIREGVLADMVATILRADPTGCGVQWSQDDGGTWNTIDLSECITDLANDAIVDAIHDGVISGPGQPPPSQPPPIDECHTFAVELRGSDRWLCPFPINTGDSVEITDASGGCWDGDLVGGSAWYCPTGQRFLFASCSDIGAHTTEGDPLNTVNHMRIVGNFAETWFDAMDGVYLAPSGVVNQPLYLQCNDSQLYDNQGSYKFTVSICNNSGTFDHLSDFSVSADGWDVAPGQAGAYGGTPPAHWGATSLGGNKVCGIAHDIALRNITDVFINVTIDDELAGEPIVILKHNGVQTARFDGTSLLHDDFTGTYHVTFEGIEADNILVQIAATGGTSICNIWNIEVIGFGGSDPF